jgi:transposase
MEIQTTTYPFFTQLIASNLFLLDKVAHLERNNAAYVNKVKLLESKLAELKANSTELKRRVKQNSQNSSLPPSRDLFVGAKARSLRNKTLKGKGGQLGHVGHTLKQVAIPDHIVVHEVHDCNKCGSDLSNITAKSKIRRQVFDLPPIKYEVTEHQLEVKRCRNCKSKVIADAGNVLAPVQYGPRIKAQLSFLHAGHFVPFERLSQVSLELYGIKVSAASIEGFIKECAVVTKPSVATIKDRLLTHALVKNLDESGCRVNGKNHWLHVISNNKLTHYRVNKRRSDLAGLAGITGVAIHDHWKAYFKLDVKHGLCNAHHLRELNGIIETYKESWAVRMQNLLRIVSRLIHKYDGNIAIAIQERIIKIYTNIVSAGLNYHESLPTQTKLLKKKPKRLPGHNMLIRLRDYMPDVLRSLTSALVPFTSNQAEQDIRMIKLRQKISGCFRHADGAERFCNIRSYLSTLAKHKQGLLPWLNKAFQKNEFEVNADLINLINTS